MTTEWSVDGRKQEQGHPLIKADVVVWESLNVDADFRGVVFRRYTADGTPLAGEELANVTEAGNQNNAVVETQLEGSFIIVGETDGQDGSEATVIARLFSTDGARLLGSVLPA